MLILSHRSITTFLWRGYEYLAMLLGLTTFVFICSLGLPAAIILLCFPKAWRVPLGRHLIAFGFSFYLQLLQIFCSVRLNLDALKAIKGDPALIIIANHPSLLDAVILLSVFPRAVCVMKASLQNNPLFGIMSRLAGYISNEDPMKLIKQSCTELAKGDQLLIFPEGTRTTCFPIDPFGQMPALIAKRADVSVQTVFIQFSSSYLGKKDALFKKPTLPLHINISLGVRANASSGANALSERLESYYREYLSSYK